MSISSSSSASLLTLLVAVMAASESLAAAAIPQDQQAKFIELRDEKLADPVFKKSDWTFDYNDALERAKKEDQVIFAYFTRSYAG